MHVSHTETMAGALTGALSWKEMDVLLASRSIGVRGQGHLGPGQLGAAYPKIRPLGFLEDMVTLAEHICPCTVQMRKLR